MFYFLQSMELLINYCDAFVMLLFLFASYFSDYRTYSLVLDIGNMITMTFSTILLITSNIMNSNKRHKIWKIFQCLNRVDIELKNFGYIINYKRQYIIYVLYGISLASVQLILHLYNEYFLPGLQNINFYFFTHSFGQKVT